MKLHFIFPISAIITIFTLPMDKAKQILKHTFGYDTFRPLQAEIIQNVLNRKDSLVIMPTGGGKSICYQVPALIFDGLTIVISPLISLMKDQVEQLRQLGITTALLNSSLSRQVYDKNYESVRIGKAKLLYLAPESLAKQEIIGLLNSVKLDCITVDEAHCISEWGHDFRPEYRQLGALRKKYSSAVCLALTATATPRVQDDIIKNLNMVEGSKFIASFNRENLFLQVIPKRNPLEQTINFLKEHENQSGIIYCFSRSQVEELHEELSYLGFSTKPYHAGLPDEERTKNQDLFIKDEIQIIIATIAFGMGINKSNVRFVLHYDLPKNIESYYQEIGRSGRDGLKSDCLLLFSYGDISKINYFINQKEDPQERLSAKAHLDAMVRYTESEVCRRLPLINYFGEEYVSESCGMCDTCLADVKELTDITIPSQKFLSSVKRTKEIFGMNYIVDILLGSESEKVLNNGHHKLTVYGIGTEFTKKQWQYIAQQLVNKQLLIRDVEFGSLKLSEKAYGVLLRNEKVYGLIKEPETKAIKKGAEVLQFDQELFELLRAHRKNLASAFNLPPYVIFSDKTLAEMAAHYPLTNPALARISGVAGAKLYRYGAGFLSIIKDYCKRKNIHPKPVPSRKEKKKNGGTRRFKIVAEAYNSGKSIDALAEEYNVKPQTILSHLTRYANLGNNLRTDELKKKVTVDNERQQEIFKYFQSAEDLSLKPLFDKYSGEISYEELHVLRILSSCK